MLRKESGPNALNTTLPYIAWTVALVGTVGSLFFSEVMDLPPCDLCWYQRIAMYPLVVILGIGIVTRDRRMKTYAMPFSLTGLAISVYHNLLYYGFISQALTPCSEGVPCTAKQLELAGFITIPLMGLAAFLVITLCLFVYRNIED
ncbi:MAG: disulfide bond formation protein B [Acidobacteria bacterium]|nr:MAG: disulfide bond formation protein B [Acidobacteriota bacterium]REK02351.1 MAG: disulfide bond formation protein B [Acidobacteriota bacterium]REK13847.1 MAG: disulfide bond formation protein B [Acidobacteriota bacterium]REK41842.1 MAG: disulfide bond formation protein B [Acidobacteriota bacterium]